MNKTTILLVEDDNDFGLILKQYLEMSAFEVYWFQNPLEVLKQIAQIKTCAIAILDVMLPDLDGFALAKKLKAEVTCPFIFLTAKNQQIDRIFGLKLGADDYISKPCDPEELVLRLNNILKRKNVQSQENYQLGDYHFNPHQLFLSHQQKTIQLTERETALLLLLIEYNNQIITREIILKTVWKTTDYFAGRSMDVFISRLRKYFQYDNRIKIQSIRSVGFQVVFPML